MPPRRFFFGDRRADLYVLDMYYPTGTTNTPVQRAKLAAAWGNCCKANRELKIILAELHQTFDGGRELAAQVARRGLVRKSPFAFFTRKGNLEDAIHAYEQLKLKPIAIIKKPDPWDETETSEIAKDDALLASRDTIRKRLNQAIDNAGFFYRHKETIVASVLSFVIGILVNSISHWL